MVGGWVGRWRIADGGGRDDDDDNGEERGEEEEEAKRRKARAQAQTALALA
jgi:hypothetical protein